MLCVVITTLNTNAAVGDIFTENSCQYKILTDSTVSFKGVDADVTDVTIPATVTNNGASYQVTEVADSAFFGNTTIQTVNISEGIEKIGVRVFYNATGLKTASLPRSATTIGRNLFYGCTDLETVEFLSKITTLPVSCFNKCESLREIQLPNTITSIGDYAFTNCSSLETVYIPDRLTALPQDCFYNLPKLKNILFSANSKLKTINMRAIYGLDSIETLNLPSTVTTFKYSTANNMLAPIGNCKKLKTINISNSKFKSFDGVVYSPDKKTLYFIPTGLETYVIDENTTTINQYACVKGIIRNVVFPENLATIGKFSFCGCENLRNLFFPENLTVIKENAFWDCHNLGQITFHPTCKLKTIEMWAFSEGGVSGELALPPNLETIGNFAFHASLWSQGMFGKYGEGSYSVHQRYGSIHKVVFPASLKRIDYQAFFACDMDSVVLNDGLEFLGDGVFGCCENLTYAYVPASVTQTDTRSHGMGTFHRCENLVKVDWYSPILPTAVFSSCYNLPSFTIPHHTEEIGSLAFSYCTSIRQIKIPNSVKTIGKQAFQNCMSFTHVTLPSHLDNYVEGMIYQDDKIYEYTIPANITSAGLVGCGTYSGISGWNYNRLLNIFIMSDEIPDTLKRTNTYTKEKVDTYGKTTFFVKPSVYHERYPDGKWSGSYILEPKYTSTNKVVNFEHDVSYKIPVTMVSASGNPIKYKTLCRDFDVDLTHTNDNLPEGVEPLRAYLVEDVDGDLRMVFLNEIKYIPSRLKANTTDSEGNRYQGVDEYVGVVLRGTPGYTYYYEIGEHDYTQGSEGQWLMDDAMAYSNSSFEQNLMAGDANDDFYVHMTVIDDNDNEVVNYGLNNNRFKIYHKDGWLTYNKAYLQLPKYVSAAIEGDTDAEGNANLTFVFQNADGTADKVSSVEFHRNCESYIFYNPYGQHVNANTKGIVINNGRKYVNK